MGSLHTLVTTRLPALDSRATRRIAAAVVLVAVVLATVWSSVLGGRIFSSDDVMFVYFPFSAQRPAGWLHPTNPVLIDSLVFYHPLMLIVRHDLFSGHLPLWNPFEGGGQPLLGNPQTAMLFPLTWLAFVLPFWSSLVWIVVAKLLLTSAGTYLYCRDLALRRGPSLLAAIAFPFGMFYFTWLEHIDVTSVWAMLPWMFLATRWVCTRGSIGAAALLGGACGLSILGGHPESYLLVLVATVVYGAFELVARRARGPSPSSPTGPWRGPSWTTTVLGRASMLVVALALGVGLSAVVTLPFLEFLHQSPKVLRGSGGLQLRELWAYVFPDLWGSPDKGSLGPPTLDNLNVRTGYIGVLPLLLAVGSLGRRRPREQWFFVGSAIVVVATIFNTPIWANWVRGLPEGTLVKLWYAQTFVSFSGGVLAAYGLQRWLTGTARDRRHMLWIMGIVALIPPLAWIPRHLSLLSDLSHALVQLPTIHYGVSESVAALASVWRWILFCGLGIAGLAVARRLRSPLLAVALIVVLTGVDLVTLDRTYHGSVPIAQTNPPVPPTVRYLQTHQGDGRIAVSGWPALTAKMTDRYGLLDIRVGDQALFPTRYENLWSSLDGVQLFDSKAFVPTLPLAHRLADVFATRYVLLAPKERAPAWLTPVFHDAGGTVAFNRTALPRAWVAYNWRQASSEPADLRLTVSSTTSTLLHDPVIEEAGVPPSGRTPPPVPARVTSDGPNSVTLDATARRPGYLILDDAAYPGWQASVDGRSTRWTPANENFRAVPIPAGHHVIRFTYRPSSVILGTVISLVCIVALLAIGCYGIYWVRRSRRSSTEDLGEITLPDALQAENAVR